MTSRARPLLQLALDVLNTNEAVRIVEQVHPWVDIIEVGTPLVIEEGLTPLKILKKKFPGKRYMADLKIADAGYLEASSGFRSGADFVTVLGLADDRTIQGALKAAGEHGGQVVADLIHIPDVPPRAQALETLGVPILCLHTAFDRQGPGVNPLNDLRQVRGAVHCRLALAGGLGLDTIVEAARGGADILIVGGGIVRQPDPGLAARQILEKLEESNPCSR